MKFNYYSLNSDLKEILFKEFAENKKKLYVFENSATFYEIKREYFSTSDNLFRNFNLMDRSSFYEKLFETDKIAVKEEKQVILFFNSLSRELKRKMKIESYYDCIDIAYSFYNLFSELQEYEIDFEKIELEEWQKNIFENLVEAGRQIRQKMQIQGVTLPYMLRKIENISEIFLEKNKEIVFVNKVKFTPFEKKVFELIEKKGVKVSNILQLDKEYFDEKKWKIKENFSLKNLKEEYDGKIEIHEFDNKLSQLMGLVNRLSGNDKAYINRESVKSEEEIKIFDAQNENGGNDQDYQLLNQNRITHNLEMTMKKTKIYKILDLIYGILESLKVNTGKNGKKKLLFKMKDLYNAFKYDDFLRIFELRKVYSIFSEYVEKEYKYISKEQLEEDILLQENSLKAEKISKFMKFLNEMEKVYQFENLKQYSAYLEEIIQKFDSEKKGGLKNEEELNVQAKYFEALTELEVIEKIYTEEELWGKNYFGDNISANLLKLFLKYLDKKAISLNLEEINENEDRRRRTVNSFSAASEIPGKKLAVINLQDDFPKIRINNFLFSKIQRAAMGLPVSEDEKRIEIFRFYQNIFGADEVYLSYVKNLDEKLDSAGAVEEIKLKYGIEPVRNEISEDSQIYFMKRYFLEEGEKYERKKIGEYIRSKLEKNLEKISNEILNLGHYKFMNLRNFEYGFYLEKMIGECETEKIKDKIEAKMFGTIIHQIYEKIVSENREQIENATYRISREDIREKFDEVIFSFRNKIPMEYIIFYEKISFEEIVKSVGIFLSALMNEIRKMKNVKIKYEEKIKNKRETGFQGYENVKISGVIDLHLISDEKEILFDYKSGKDSSQKIKEAFSQLDYYDILLSDNRVREKWVINTWDGQEKIGVMKKLDESGKPLKSQEFAANEFPREEKDILKMEDIEETVERYFNEKYCDLGKKSINEYEDVCRREDEADDDGE